MDEKNGKFTAEETLRAALYRAISWGAREVRFSDTGVTLKDALGNPRVLKRMGQDFNADSQELSALLEDFRFNMNRNWRAPKEERVFKGLGSWLAAMPDGGGMVLKPKKPFAPCVDALAEVEGDGLARLRSLYRRGGFDVFALCEGETRTKDLALAFAAERRMLGLPTKVEMLPEEDYGRAASAEDQFGPEVFDPDGDEAGESWDIVHAPWTDALARLHDADSPEGTRLFIAQDDRYFAERLMRAQAELDRRERPAVFVSVTLEKSKPVMRALFSRSLLPFTSADDVFQDAPWAVFAERKAAREKSRKPVPRTWHQTSEAVAEAFIERKAPRGFVSARNLFFHGPVAYSCHGRNPVAAIVDVPGHAPVVFVGRENGIGGGKGAVVSMAQGDVERAAKAKGYEVFRVGELTEFLAIGNTKLDEFHYRVARTKEEAAYPSSCKVDRRKLKAFVTRKHREAVEELEAASKSGFPTYRKAAAYSALAVLACMRERLADVLGPLPGVGDSDEYRRLSVEAREAAESRRMELRERKSRQEPAGNEEEQTPSPSM